MTDNELLLAISNMVQSQIEPLRKDIKDVEQSLSNRIDTVEQSLSSRIDTVEQSCKNDITSIKLLLENDILPRLQNIEECYISTYKRYASGINQIDAMQSDINIMKKVIAEHSEQLKKFA